MWTECTVYVVCNNHQIRVVIPDDAHDARHCIRTECVAGRITGIGDKEGLDFRAFQAVYVFVAVLPEVHPFVIHAVGMYFGHSKLVAAELWDFNIGGKGRNHEDDAVPFVQQEVFLQGVEDVAHGGCSTFGGKQVIGTPGRTVVAHLLRKVILHKDFCKMKDAVGHGILVAYNAFGPFVYKAVGVGGMLHQQVVVGLFQQFGARYVIVLFQEGFEAGGNAFFFGDACNSLGQIHDAAALFQAEASQQEEGFAWSGCNPVGVAAPCVQHGTGGFLQTLVCHVYQAVLQFERTDRFHFLF